jgi:hypothetical protein
VILVGLLVALVLGGLISLVVVGVRAGDRPGDALLLDVAPRSSPRGARATLTNPGGAPVIFGISLRRPGLRVRLEGGSYVRIRTGRTDSELLAARQAQVGALAAGETRTFVVPAGARLGRRAELVVVIGQSSRLRTVHRLLVLPQSGFSARTTGWAGRRPAAGPPRRAAPAPRPVSD